MAKDNYIYKYYQAINNGKVTVGKWIALLYEQLVKGIKDKEYIFDNNKAHKAINWIEKHAFHVEGTKAPSNLELELWQKAMLSAIHGIVDEDGYKHFREVLFLCGRKCGKSLIASAEGRYNWYIDGGYGSRVFVVAPKLDQAGIVYDNIWTMTELDPEQKERKAKQDEQRANKKKIIDDPEIARHRMSDLYLPSNNGAVKKIAFSAKKSDGFNPSLCICDEVAAWEGDKGLKQYEVMKSGMGARPDGMMFSCSTAGYINDSIYDELMKRSTRFLLGESKETRLLPFLYMIDDIEKWNDINELQKSIPNLNVSVSVDFMLEEIAIAEGSLSKKVEFITKYCNVKQNSSLAWLPAEVVQKASEKEYTLDDFRDCYCVGGIDLSQTTDLTACTLVVEKNGELYCFSHFFLPREKIDEASQRDGLPYNTYIQKGLLTPSGDNFIDYHDCYNWFTDKVENYQLLPLRVGYDRYSAQYLVQDMKSYGFVMDDVYQGENLHPVINEVGGLLKDGKLHIGHNDLMKIHLLNSALKMSTERGRGKLVKISPNMHIDGAAALLDAMTVRQKWYGEIGEQLQNN